jgi:glutathione S-transferase
VIHSALRPRRPEVEQLSGQRKLPLIEFEDGTILGDSSEIAARAHAGTLLQMPAQD